MREKAYTNKCRIRCAGRTGSANWPPKARLVSLKWALEGCLPDCFVTLILSFKAQSSAKRPTWRRSMPRLFEWGRPLACMGLLIAMAGCKMPGEQQDFSKLSEDFVYGSLALSPVSATGAGYHEHRGVHLDEKLDD